MRHPVAAQIDAEGRWPLEQAGLCRNTAWTLHREGIHDMDTLASMSDEDIRQIRHIGATRTDEIRDVVRTWLNSSTEEGTECH